MERYIAFFTQHWGLSLLLLIILLAIAIYELGAKGIGPKRTSVQKAVQLMNHDGAMVIDLRDCSSFEQGHIINALNVPINELKQKITTLNKHQHKPIILVLASGQQSLQATKLFAKNGFTNVSVLGGGMRVWREANLPVEK
ncbi:MAG: rhodanese-like domain-containing protein [Gammaproteobacteria bacterium]